MAYLLIPLILLLVSLVYYRKKIKPSLVTARAIIVISIVAFVVLTSVIVGWLVYLTVRKAKFPELMKESMATTADGVYTYDMLSGAGLTDKQIRKTYPELIIG
jgi:hypothetical protein